MFIRLHSRGWCLRADKSWECVHAPRYCWKLPEVSWQVQVITSAEASATLLCEIVNSQSTVADMKIPEVSAKLAVSFTKRTLGLWRRGAGKVETGSFRF